MRRYEITDEQWALIEDLFPPLIGNGRPFRDHRMMVNACFWILNTGSPCAICPNGSAPGRRPSTASTAGARTARSRGFWSDSG